MTRLLVLVEGQTEETFVNDVLAKHLYQHGYASVSARIMGNARQRSQRGGVRPFESFRSDAIRHLRGDSGVTVTSMVDYYGLPATGSRAWPGREEAPQLAPDERAPHVEHAIHASICNELGPRFDPHRFVPYVMMHEFEAMLFSDCASFGKAIGHSQIVPTMQAMRNKFATPEDINDSPHTAPSKRIESLVPGYQKPTMGTFGILEIGLERVRAECPHFRHWVETLEQRMSV
jgi:hypothetical protein